MSADIFKLSFQRPNNNTTTYAAGSLVANSISGGSVVIPGFRLPGTALGPIRARLNFQRLWISDPTGFGVGGGGASAFLVNLFGGPTAPVPANGDGAPADFVVGVDRMIATFGVSIATAWTGGALAQLDPVYAADPIIIEAGPGDYVWWALQTGVVGTGPANPLVTFRADFAFEPLP